MEQPHLPRQILSLPLVAVSSIAFLGVLLVHSYIGTFGRYVADDYCTASALGARGFWGAQAYWFTEWTGRFAFTMAISIAHCFGPKVVRVIPTVVLFSWVAALTWTILQLTRSIASGLVGLLLAEIVIFSTLATTPSVYQSLYWMTGSLTYVFPLVISTIYVGLTIRIATRNRRPGAVLIILGGLLTLIASGFSEVHAALQVAALLVALVACAAIRRTGVFCRTARGLLVSGLIGATLGSAILVGAPGNNVRIAGEVASGLSTSPSHSALEAIKISTHFALDLIIALLKAWSVPATVLALAALVGFCCSETNGIARSFASAAGQLGSRLFITAVLTGFLIVVCFVPPAYVSAYMRATYYPPARLFVIPQFVFYCGTCVAGFLTGVTLRRIAPGFSRESAHYARAVFAVAWVLVLLVALSWVRNTWNIQPMVRTFAAAWDEQDEKIRAATSAGARTVHIDLMPTLNSRPTNSRYFGLRLMDKAPDNWVNECAAEFYGVDSIVAD